MSRIPGQRLRPVLSETEKTCGAAVIDIGAQTTSIIVMAEGRVQFTDVRPWGAEIFTRDLAMVLGISLEEAEELKRNSGECRLSQVIAGEVVQFESHGALSTPLFPGSAREDSCGARTRIFPSLPTAAY